MCVPTIMIYHDHVRLRTTIIAKRCGLRTQLRACARCEEMFHMFHGLSTLWNTFVEHRIPHSNAACEQINEQMFHCSSKNRFYFSVGRRPLLFVL